MWLLLPNTYLKVLLRVSLPKTSIKDQIIADYNGSTFMLPASTQKVFTAVAAKLVLGDAFQFETSLLSNGKIQNNVLEGDLVVQFTGDPDLTSGQLYSLLANLKKPRHSENQW